jgi:hypothetical protein
VKITKAQFKQIIKEELLKENLDDPFWRKDADALQLLQKGGAALKSILAKASPEDLKALKAYLYAPMGASIREEGPEVESIAGRDVPNEVVYPAIIAGFTDVLNGHLGEQYNFYKELNNIAKYYAKNFGG